MIKANKKKAKKVKFGKAPVKPVYKVNENLPPVIEIARVITKEVFSTKRVEKLYGDIEYLSSEEFSNLDDNLKREAINKIKDSYSDILPAIKKYLV